MQEDMPKINSLLISMQKNSINLHMIIKNKNLTKFQSKDDNIKIFYNLKLARNVKKKYFF